MKCKRFLFSDFVKCLFQVVNQVLCVLYAERKTEKSVMKLFGIKILTFIVLTEKDDQAFIVTERYGTCYQL